MRDWCEEYNVLFKLNTVVNKFNYQEDMVEPLKKLNPVRWKVFQCLPVEVKYFTYRCRALKSRSELRTALNTFLLHENLSLFSKTFSEKLLSFAIRAVATLIFRISFVSYSRHCFTNPEFRNFKNPSANQGWRWILVKRSKEGTSPIPSDWTKDSST